MVDCAKRELAVKENWYYHDEKANRVYEHKVVAQPGWSTAIGGSMRSSSCAMWASCLPQNGVSAPANARSTSAREPSVA